MTIIDANVILRAIVRPATKSDILMAHTATTLIERVKQGNEMILLTDAVVAEVVFILSSRRHYGIPRVDVVARLTPIFRLSGCRLTQKRFVLAALDLWASTPKISFVDALVATYAQALGQPLASFDIELGKVAGITLWQPPP